MLTATIDALRVPSEFGRVEHIVDENVLSRLDVWKTGAEDELERLLRDASLSSSGLSVSEQARVVFVAGAFDGDGGWVTKRSLNTSRGERGQGFSCWSSVDMHVQKSWRGSTRHR
jgi:hypothetical protein